MKISVLFGALGVCALPVLVAANPLHGTWCDAVEIMHIDPYGIGFNEHTICDVIPQPEFTQGGYVAEISCSNVYVNETETGTTTVDSQLIPEIKTIEITALGPDRIEMKLNSMDTKEIMDRCD